MKIAKREKFIGIFDSGFGGVSTLRGIVREIPEYSYIYLGDNARTPYGTRSQKVIYEFSCQAVNFLFKKNCDLIIFACNTASSKALRKIQQNYVKKQKEKKVLGVLIPAVEEATKKTKNKKIAVIGTEGTIESKAYIKEIKIIDKSIKVYQKATPLLVPLVESGEYSSKITKTILRNYLKDFLKKDIDTLILGCTHYGILEKKIRQIVGPKINIISDKYVVPKKLKNYLFRHPEIESSLKKNSSVSFYTTDLTEKFVKLGSKFFGRKIKAKKTLL
jgi:glutamate racemase